MLRATRATWTHGRRGAVIGASAAIACLGAVLGACGGGSGRDGYAAVGGPPLPTSATAAIPTEEVTLVPLDSVGTSRHISGGSPRATAKERHRSPEGAAIPSPRNSLLTGATSEPSTHVTSRSSTATPLHPPPTESATLSIGEPGREPTDQRWCEKVTVAFHNTGGSTVRSGTVTFGTHVVDRLGIDWTTVESTEPLPAPIAAGEHGQRTWTVCVEAWRVPLGMHVETRDVSVRWE